MCPTAAHKLGDLVILLCCFSTVLKTNIFFNLPLIFVKKLLCQYIKMGKRAMLETEFQKTYAYFHPRYSVLSVYSSQSFLLALPVASPRCAPSRTRTRARTCAHAHTNMHAHVHVYTLADAHVHTRTVARALLPPVCCFIGHMNLRSSSPARAAEEGFRWRVRNRSNFRT